MKNRNKIIIILIIILIAIGGYLYLKNKQDNPEQVLNDYVAKINEEKYDEMYEMISEESKQKITQEDFVNRNENIYQGIDMTNMEIEISQIEKSGKQRIITYKTKMNVSGTEVSFDNKVTLSKGSEKTYKIDWSSNLIFPELNDTDKVRVNTVEAIRGTITDRNGVELASNGTASSVGIVPGKLSENREADIEKMAELLNTTADSINSKLQASWVKDDSFVPIKTISLNETELKEQLLQIRCK